MCGRDQHNDPLIWFFLCMKESVLDGLSIIILINISSLSFGQNGGGLHLLAYPPKR